MRLIFHLIRLVKRKGYGFAGSALFPESVLLTGWDVVSLITSGASDNYSDKSAIKQGYSEAL